MLGAWLLLAFIAYATMSPIQDRPSLPASSSFEHIIAFALLGFAFDIAYPQKLRFVCLIVFGSAVLLEVLQVFTPDRHGRVLDAVEKIVGGAFGIVIGWMVLKVGAILKARLASISGRPPR